MKHCNLCKIIKHFDQFSKASREKDGLQDRCKLCQSKWSAEYRKLNKEKEQLRHAKYHAENKEKINKRVSNWQKENKEKCRERSKRFYHNNKEKEKLRHKKWMESNPNWKKEYSKKFRENNREYFKKYEDYYWRKNQDKVYKKNAKRRAQRLMATVKWANEDKILEIYKKCIELTKKTGIIHHVDHIIPLINDKVCGLHCEDNLQILTASENLSKNNSFEG